MGVKGTTMSKNFFDAKAKEWDGNSRRVERAQAVAKDMARALPDKSLIKALEVGCGTGLLGFNLISLFRHITFSDISAEMLVEVECKLKEGESRKGTTLNFDFTQGRYEGLYDCIFSLHQFHHIEDIPTYIENLTLSLNSGGFLCISDLDSEDGSFHNDEKDRYYHDGIDREFLKRTLIEKGYNIFHESTPFVNRKNGRDYPIFLIIGRKL